MYLIKLFSLLCLCVWSTDLSSQEADKILGKWKNSDGKAVIEIYKNHNKYFGKIVWLKEPNNGNGQPKVDDKNPDKSLHTRPVLGLELLKNFTYDDDLEWEDGTIYDVKSGKTYSCVMELKENVLEITGYIGISLFGRTVEWTKVI